MNAALDRDVDFVSANMKTIPHRHSRDRLCRHDPDVHVSDGEVGKEGIITVTAGHDEIEGMQFDCEFSSPYFVTEMMNHSAEFENPPVLLARRPACYRIYCRSREAGRSLVVIAEDVDGEAFRTTSVGSYRSRL